MLQLATGAEAIIRIFSDGQLIALICPEPDSNRHGWLKPRDFKSLASTDFATRAREGGGDRKVRRAIVLIMNPYVGSTHEYLLLMAPTH